ncbi:MAG: hypothetical protein WCH98_09720 [Verrucomicrobiota bacterium]
MKIYLHNIFRHWFGGIFAALFCLVATGAYAGYVDITVNDGSPSWTYGTDPRPGVGESGETEANTINNASWDLRAFAFDPGTSQLMVVSAFDPLTLNGGVGIGDIFIDINNSFTVPSRPNSGNGYFDYANSGVGYEYAIDLIDPSHGGLGYNVVALSGASILRSGEYAQNAISDPATLVASGADSILSSGVFSVTTKTDAQVYADLGINIGTNGGTNYVFSFNLSSVSFADGATFRLTQECGNDLLVGKAVPETSTWVMGFVAVAAVVCMLSRRAKPAM